MENTYFFIDGSALLHDIDEFKTKNKISNKHRFDIQIFVEKFQNKFDYLHNGEYRRVTFYHVVGDERVDQMINIPCCTKMNRVFDLVFNPCGMRLKQEKKSAEWLNSNNAPQYVLDTLHKSEKAVDTQICCDALTLLVVNKLDRLFLYTNDYDFFPLCKTLKSLGANINIVKLFDDKINEMLARECDGICSFSKDEILGFLGKTTKKNPVGNGNDTRKIIK